MFIVTKKIDGENISKVCRTCLREDNDKMVCLFIGPPESSLGAKLQSLSCLNITQGDGLPEKMCDRCVTRAESAILFREQCRAADQALRQAAVQVFKDKALQQQNADLVPLHYSQNTSQFNDYRTFADQEFYVQNRLHPPFYQREENPPQHMHVVETHNSYFHLSHYNNYSINHEIMPNGTSVMQSENFDSLSRYNPVHNRASCALQCSLCNYTFTNRDQLVNHSFIHNSDNVDASSDEINVEIEENSIDVERTINYERSIDQPVEHSIQNISCGKIDTVCNNGYQNFNFTNNISDINSVEVSVTNNISDINSVEVNVTNNISDINSVDINMTNNISDINSVEVNVTNNISHINPIEVNVINSRERNIASSIESSALAENRFKCEICCRLFDQKSKLETHQLTHSRKKPFECIHCGRSYSSKSKLAAHVRLHTRTNIYQCNICQKIFSYPSYLSEHMKTHDTKIVEEKPSFKCNQCNKSFYIAKSYKRHMKFHSGKGLFHCDICDKVFSQKYSLKVHVQSHVATKFHKCHLCNKSFNQKSNLVEHMRTHTKVKPFKCKICEKSFTQSSHLKNHEVSHNTVRQFQCRICGKKFKLSSHLKRHVNSHAGLKMYKCDQCDQTFSQAFSLKRHTKKHME